MNAHFKHFDRDQHQMLSQVDNRRGLLDLLMPWLVIAAALVATRLWPSLWTGLAAVIVISSRQSALINLAHDAWHGLSLRPKRFNDVVGAWCYAYPVGIPYFHDRQRHLSHHRLVGTPADPDWINYTNQGRGSRTRLIGFLAGRLFGSLLWQTVRSALLTRQPRIVATTAAAETGRLELVKIALVQAALCLLFFAASGSWYASLLFWMLPLATLTSFCIAVRGLVEHLVADDECLAEQRLRDTRANWLERHFLSPAHFHYHALHHSYPAIPHWNLRAASQQLDQVAGGYPFRREPGYFRQLYRHLRQLP